MKTGIEIIAQERLEQIEKHLFTAQNDSEYTSNELIRCAICYLMADNLDLTQNEDGENLIVSGYWPWAVKWWKPAPKNRIKELAKAGALIAAEIDRLQN